MSLEVQNGIRWFCLHLYYSIIDLKMDFLCTASAKQNKFAMSNSLPCKICVVFGSFKDNQIAFNFLRSQVYQTQLLYYWRFWCTEQTLTVCNPMNWCLTEFTGVKCYLDQWGTDMHIYTNAHAISPSAFILSNALQHALL